METLQYDLWLMSGVIFVPTLFALILMAVPKSASALLAPGGGFDEAVRWITLFGTAVTMVLSFFMFISYYRMFDMHLSEPKQTLLSARVEAADKAERAGNPAKSDDWVARVPWIPRFKIDYFL